MGGAEGSRFQQDVHGLVGDFGLQTAHNARQSDGALGRGDHGHVGDQLSFLPVQGGELLALLCSTNDDVGTTLVVLIQLVVIEGMQGLAQQEQHVVGDVDDVVDGSCAGSGNALRQPFGTGTHLDVADDACGITRAELGIGNLHGAQVACGLIVFHQLDTSGYIGNGYAVHGADLTGHTLHGEAVGTVGGDFQVEDTVGQAPVLGEVHAHGRIFGQDHQAVDAVVAQAQFLGRAVHTQGNLAAQLALLDLEVAGQHGAHHGDGDLVAHVEVLRTADDLQGFGISLAIGVAVGDID